MTETEVDPDTWGQVYIKGISRKKKKKNPNLTIKSNKPNKT